MSMEDLFICGLRVFFDLMFEFKFVLIVVKVGLDNFIICKLFVGKSVLLKVEMV